jgi:phosphopantothenoylcysteine decarboxylase/phosphopantothenate--cysteine ligase
MGYALAAAAARRGAEVVLVSGPVALDPPLGVEVIAVEDARAMQAAIDARAAGQDLIVMAAAVADFRPVAPSDRKLKRTEIGYTPTIALDSNPDILAALGAARKARGATLPVLVGFAAETHDVVDYAQAKLAAKGVDMIVANDVTEPGAGFGTDTNRVVLVEPGGDTPIPAGPKAQVAHRILDRAIALLAARR